MMTTKEIIEERINETKDTISNFEKLMEKYPNDFVFQELLNRLKQTLILLEMEKEKYDKNN